MDESLMKERGEEEAGKQRDSTSSGEKNVSDSVLDINQNNQTDDIFGCGSDGNDASDVIDAMGQLSCAEASSSCEKRRLGLRTGSHPEPLQIPPPPSSPHYRMPYVWRGELPSRNYTHPVFSCKLFVGGVPWDVTEQALLDAFCPYGPCRVEWPGKESRYHRFPNDSRLIPRGKMTGYVYMIFEQDMSVKALLQDCSQDFGSAGEWYFKMKARRNFTTETRQVQVIPWVVSDSAYVDDPSARLDTKKTVFVGALHGMITAQVLFSIMNQLYGNVVFVGIDTDKYKYPIGSGRVTFSTHASYFRAIESAFLEIDTTKFTKKVQIDPFLEDSLCMVCGEAQGPLFCRNRACFRYFCESCWAEKHNSPPNSSHRPLMRTSPRPEWPSHGWNYPETGVSRGGGGQAMAVFHGSWYSPHAPPHSARF